MKVLRVMGQTLKIMPWHQVNMETLYTKHLLKAERHHRQAGTAECQDFPTVVAVF